MWVDAKEGNPVSKDWIKVVKAEEAEALERRCQWLEEGRKFTTLFTMNGPREEYAAWLAAEPKAAP